ncbi:NAD(P)-dependent dehydrogenase (short-subunit alcohol dehydrogenase family) [Actinoplanes lutulentus]|uniref:NADP-dependent 3-hydroxy acid dehydrogenase YdfG n=1 Tax=Actinoplanes lutulentus TaxID=1287878 RepID=A0A327Z511_9ACTN|nr:SDR family NAD(P)-dependent oxidoreductase [Actinoplanes lutulentus]MBB2947687.1 NAD(P)-dependent dehydrogenase (short-subunit alcohol dehydrogenase family) [Actinoplanes lutulentus]RAK27743.1 NADP-dependent 3-hydroxy acid dehydrogenase YdfG [Actinoplanes lutulentus]
MSKVWLITGTSRGLGRQLAESVLAAGDRVVATTRRAVKKERQNDRLRTVALDVTDPASARAAVAAAIDAFGRLDVVVNNAGYADVASIEDMPEDSFRAQIDANFFGVVNVTRAALPVLRAQGSGHIVQVSSVGGRVGSTGLGAYQSAKWAVGGFSEVLAKEVAPFGIKVTIAEPGAMRTDWAGASMSTHPISAPYVPVIEPAVERLRAADGNQSGDPAKIAQVLIDLVAHPEPPLHLLLGADAYAVAQAQAETLAKTDAAWRAVSESVTFVHDS